MNLINKNPNLIQLLLLTSLLKGVIFAVIIPLWHTPDEQAHFAQIAYFAEFNKMPNTPFDLNKEVYQSEELLGTLRDERGNNKFTFHPEYRIDYTNKLNGRYEDKIINLPKEYRKELVKQEAANYPPLYYWIGGVGYKIFYNQDLIVRVFIVRFISILMGVGVVYVAWLIGRELFPKIKIYQITLPVMVSFQPMFSFVSSGVTSDNLMNLLFSIVIYLCILIIKQRMNLNIVLGLILTMILLYVTKPQFILAIPIIVVALILSIIFNYKFTKRTYLFAIILGGFILSLGYLLINNNLFLSVLERIYPQSYDPGKKLVTSISFLQFLKQTITHTIAEVIPWYWGVYNWLGVTYPRLVHQVINRIMILAAIGLVVKIILLIKKRQRDDLLFLFLIISVAIYFFGITYYNYLFTLSHGFPFGIQGRYYFPTIIPQMAILLIGLSAFIPSKYKVIRFNLAKFFGFMMAILNMIALWTIASSYYDLSSFTSFITQASQYKPLIFKGMWLFIWVFIYGLVLSMFLFDYLRLNAKQDEI